MIPDLDNLTDEQIVEMLDGWVDDLPDGSRKLRLDEPLEIQIGSHGRKAEPMVIEELIFGKPKADILDLAAAKGETMKIARAMLASIIRPPVEGVKLGAELHLKQMDLADFFRAQLVMGLFFPKPPRAATLETTEN